MTESKEAKPKGSILKKGAIALLLAIGIFMVVVALQPGEYKVERRLVMNAPAAAVFAQVNDFHLWDAWSPWAKLDPAMKATFEGPPSGKGSVYAWTGNSNVGEGKMTITESSPPDRIVLELVFIKPMAGSSTTEFSFKPEGAGTSVTWTMTGKNDFVGKAVCMFMNMDKMVGGQFEKGLESMKSLVEAPAKK